MTTYKNLLTLIKLPLEWYEVYKACSPKSVNNSQSLYKNIRENTGIVLTVFFYSMQEGKIKNTQTMLTVC